MWSETKRSIALVLTIVLIVSAAGIATPGELREDEEAAKSQITGEGDLESEVETKSLNGTTFILWFNESGIHSYNQILVTEAGNYLIILNGGNPRAAYVLTLSPTGDIIWNKTLSDVRVKSVIQASNGGYILAGQKFLESESPEALFLKMNENGAITKNVTYGGGSNDYFNEVVRGDSGAIYLVGHTYSFSNDRRVFVVKVQENGTEIWSNDFAGSNAWSATSAPVGSVAYLDARYNSSTGGDLYLVTLGVDGNLLWERKYGGESYDGPSIGHNILQSTNESYVLAGVTKSYGVTNQSGWLLKSNFDGTEQWNRTYFKDTRFDSIAPSVENRYMVAGADIQKYTISPDQSKTSPVDSDLFVASMSSDGSLIWNVTYDIGSKNTLVVPTSIVRTQSQIVVSGQIGNATEGIEDYNAFIMGATVPSPDQTPGDITGNGETAGDPNGDGVYEDVNGDGSFNIVDVNALFQNYQTESVQNNKGGFDFNGDGSVNIVDVNKLFQEVL